MNFRVTSVINFRVTFVIDFRVTFVIDFRVTFVIDFRVTSGISFRDTSGIDSDKMTKSETLLDFNFASGNSEIMSLRLKTQWDAMK